MRLWQKICLLFLVTSFLTVTGSRLAEARKQNQPDRPDWSDRWNKPDDNQPPGWDRGKKTGWRGQDEPPGQEKKHRHKHKKKYQSQNQERYSEPPLIVVPAPR